MQLTKTKEKEILKVYDTWMTAYLNADVDTYDSYFDKDYHFIGSTNNEEFLNRKDTTEFFKDTGEQFAGLMDLRNESKTLEQFDTLIFITHFCDVWFLNEEQWRYFGRFRLYSIMKHTDAWWRFRYHHFSMPDSKSEEGQTIGFDKIKVENQELREAIQRRTKELELKNRELEVETALERIRAQAVAMKASSDLLDIVVTMRNEFIKLGHDAHYFWHMMWLPEAYEKAMTSGDGSKIGFVMTLPRHIHGDIPKLAKWEKSKKPTVVYTMDVAEAIDYVNKMISLGDFQNIDPQAPSHDDIRHIGGLTFVMARTTHGEIGYSLPGIVKNPPKEDLEILIRFAGTFDLAHKRFMDLQKAEAQAREAEIELALERVRAKTMAMVSSDDLRETVLVINEQLSNLSFDSNACNIIVLDKTTGNARYWVSGFTKDMYPVSYEVPYINHPYYDALVDPWKKGKQYQVYSYSGKDKKDFDKLFFKNTGFKNVPREAKQAMMSLKSVTLSTAYFSHGALQVLGDKALTPNKASILQRFSNVFEQTYTRFLDLQKAEKQAKESKIEAALERIRASTMAMHKSHELAGVVKRINRELLNLNIHLDTTQILTDITNDPQKGFNIWIAVDGMDYLHKFHYPYLNHAITQSFYKNQEKQIAFYSEQVDQEEKNSYFKLVFKYSDFKSIPKERQKVVFDAPGWTRGIVFLTNSILVLSRYKKEAFNEEETQIFVRIGKVFEQAYTRFLDLQKAEAQARESQIEAALERVRSRSMAMHHTSELQDVIHTVHQQFTQLEIEITGGVFIGINEDIKETLKCWGSGGTADYIQQVNIPYINLPIYTNLIEGIQKGSGFFTEEFTHDEKIDFLTRLFKIPPYNSTTKKHQKEVLSRKGGYTRSCAVSKNSCIFIISHHGHIFSKETNNILKRFAKVFEQAYTRFLDLQKAEAQARESQIEAALERVRSASMAMHKSHELHEVIQVLFEQLQQLSFNIDAANFVLNYRDKEDFTLWAAVPGQLYPTKIQMPLIDTPILNRFIEAKEQNLDFYADCFSFEEKNEFFEHFFNHVGGVTEERKQYMLSSPGYARSTILLKNIALYILNYSGIPYSDAENSILKRFAYVFEQCYTRFLDLQKAEAQAKESQIEAALEKVRSRSLAMHKSNELNNVVAVLFENLKDLEIPITAVGIQIYLDNSKDMLNYVCGENAHGLVISSYRMSYFDNPIIVDFQNARDNKTGFFVGNYSKKEKDSFYNYLFENTDIADVPDDIKDMIFNSTSYTISMFSVSNSMIAINDFEGKQLSENHASIIKRFTKVFEQAYIRFLDLQKAEAQARESKIEASLERVRAQAMAMHHTDDLGKTIKTFYDQLDYLFDTSIVRCGAGLLNRENYEAEMFSASRMVDGNINIVKGLIDMQGHPLLDTTFKHWLEQKELYYVLKGNEIREYYKYITNQVAVPKNKGEDELHFYFPMFEDGSFYVVTEKPIEKAELDVFRRFNSVLSLTYRRFNDLHKAEIQAREAQIEAALERIRSRSMAMHRTDELSEVILVLFKQFERLGLVIDTCIIDIFDNTNSGFNVWVGTGTAVYPRLVHLPYTDHPLHLLHINARQQNIDFYTYDEDKASKDKYFKHFYLNAKGIVVPRQRKEYIAKSIGMTGSHALGEHSCVGIWNYRRIKYSSEENDILNRVNTVFQQTYTRFLDLQKAEAREREAIKQASLDRVRAEIASMRNATDLQRITPLVWSELLALGVPFFRCGVMLVNEDTKILDFYLTNPEGQALAALHLDFDSSEFARNGIEYWRKKEVYIEHWDQEQFIGFMKQLMSQGHIADATTYQGGEQAPTSLTLQFIPFTQGMVYVGSEEELSKDELDLVGALGKSLAVAYARYEDFTKLDIAKAEADKALLDLKSVQEQMIQQEKLASLGQLTAGIAHEIKNPLNFVNNFSDLSRELIEEVFDELAKVEHSEAKEDIIAILNDVKSNLTKVNEHGTRADGIVTSMLQHSRASGSKREPKPFNPLVKEFVNLSFHGMRAGKSPINVKIDLQLDPKINKVTLISEDFSRVILNLSNNAFDAMRDKLRQPHNSEDYVPELKIKTKKEKDMIILSIADNGPGIPKDIKDKILQPFFTTKKGTEGTGLGLSITNDIIKAHRGELTLESTEGEGTVFSIKIPIQ